MSAIPLETKLAALVIQLGADAAPAPSTAADLQPRSPVSLVRRVWQVLVTLCAVTAAAAFLLLAVGPHVLGYRTATMLTGSMSPGINPGDVVVTVPRAVGDVRVGDVITYEIPVDDHRVETHRVVQVTRDGAGRPAVVTKGDANSGVDPWVATLEGDTVWGVTLVVPHVGDLIRSLRSGLGHGWVLWGALAGAVLLTLRTIWLSGDDEEAAPADEGPAA